MAKITPQNVKKAPIITPQYIFAQALLVWMEPSHQHLWNVEVTVLNIFDVLARAANLDTKILHFFKDHWIILTCNVSRGINRFCNNFDFEYGT